MKILCHVGPWSKGFFESVCEGIESDSDVLISSAHKSVDDSGISHRYYDFLTKNRHNLYTANEKDEDIIARCRLLRDIPKNQAMLHLNSMREAIAEMFEFYKPDLVLSETIDAYIMDLFYEECKQRNIKFIGLVTCFVNGYFRVSARGEYHNLREPDDSEVERVLNMIEEKSYAPSFVASSKNKPYKSVLKRWVRNLIKPPYFFIKRFLSGEKYNYHYWATQIISSQWFHILPRLNLGQADWENQLEVTDKPIIYVPLQMVPEATVDYWCESLDYIDYDTTLLKFIDNFSTDFHFLIKEHPNVLGFRHPGLYKKLQARNNVTICPTNTRSNEIIDKFDSTLVWTGTVGFESALRGKPVITFCRPFYASGSMFFEIGLNTKAEDIIDFIDKQSSQLADIEKSNMIKYLLSGLLPGAVKFDGTWSAKSDSDVLMATSLGRNLAIYVQIR